MNNKPTYEKMEQITMKLGKETKDCKKASGPWQDSEEMYRDLFENAPSAYFSVSADDGSILRCNTASIKLLGYDKEALLGMKVLDLYADTSCGMSKAQNVFKQFKKGESIRDVELQMKHKTGYPIWVSLSINPVNVDGRVIESRSVVIDISERKRSEEALRKSERYYRSLLGNLHEDFLVIDRDYFITDVNKSFIVASGYRREEVIGHCCYEVLHGYRRPCEKYGEKCALHNVFETGKPSNCKHVHIRADGQKVGVEILLSPLKNDEGTVTHVIESVWEDSKDKALSVAIEVSAQKRAEKELERRTNELKERVKELNYLYNLSQLVEKRDISLEEIIQGAVDLIPKAWQYPEITCAQIIMGDQEFKTKNFRKTNWKQTCDIIVHGALSGSVEVYYLEERPTSHEGPFLKEERILIDNISGRLAKITERMRSEKNVRLLKEKYEDLYQNAPIMYLSLDTNGVIIECNNAIVDKLGYAKKEIIGKHMTKFLAKESIVSFQKDFPKLKKTGKLMGVERQLITKSKKIIDVQVSVSGEYDDRGNLIKTRASFEDISRLKSAQERIHSLTQSLINAQESERHMISHELHDRIAQDLATLKIGFESLLYNQANLSPEENQKASEFSKIFKNTIAAVRDLSYNLRPPFLDEMGLVEAISNFCESFSEVHGVSVHFHAAGMDQFKLNFETEINLYRLVQEGLNNIRKHAEATDAFIKLVAVSPNILLRIEDNGQGFDVKRRLEAAINEKRMGLRSMEERTSLLGGEMTVKSFPLNGTKILIKIPQKKSKNGTEKIDTDR